MKLRRIKIFNQVLENCRFCQNSGNEANGRSWEGVGAYCLHHYDALHRKVDIYIYILYIYIYIYIYLYSIPLAPIPKTTRRHNKAVKATRHFGAHDKGGKQERCL